MRPSVIWFVLFVSACAKSQSESVTADTPRVSSTDTARAEVEARPAAQTTVEKFAISSPAAGDTLVEGRSYVVRWTAGSVRRINLGAAMGGHDKGLLLNEVAAKPDSLIWKVPIGFVTGFGPASSNQVRLRLENADSTDQWVESGPFVVRGGLLLKTRK